MVRTQIYLTERQRDELAAIAKTAGKKQSELIREAVDRYIDQSSRSRREAVLREAAGIWKSRNDLPDFKATPYVNLSFAIFNAGLAAMSMNMAAEALGIRSIMLSETGRAGLLDCAYLKEKLDLPEHVLPLTTLVLGRSGMQFPGIPPRQPRQAVIMPGKYDRSAGSLLSDWHEQMFIGYKLTHPLSSFEQQLAHYRKKMVKAEQDIRDIFFPAGKSPG